MIAESKNFFELDFHAVYKIVSSSKLNIHSEIELFNASISWLKHNIKIRRKFAKKILLKVRLHLVPNRTLTHLLDTISLQDLDTKYVNELKELTNDIYSQTKSSSNHKSRYCDQDLYNVLICGGRDAIQRRAVKSVHQIDGNSLKKSKVLTSMIKERTRFQSVCLNGEVYIFTGVNDSGYIRYVENYSPSSNKWRRLTKMFDHRIYFCACEFVDKILLLGGYLNIEDYATNSCLSFNPKTTTWKKVAEMKEPRTEAACVVFQGNVVVSGGIHINRRQLVQLALNTVEGYDAVENRWSSMPSMMKSKFGHSLVVSGNKLFAIENLTSSFEVFDNALKKFVLLKCPLTIPPEHQVVSMGNKIVMFSYGRPLMICYDVCENYWSKIPLVLTKNLSGFSCVTVPWFLKL